ncbi:MAG TPA: sigma-70 family RNA polymerase sigma factor [Planctomycetota bacterium]
MVPPLRAGGFPDEALVARLLGGEPDALDRWYRAEHPRVHRLCFGFLADATEADDLAQDAMLHLLDRLDRWNPARPYAAWRNVVVLNLCRDRRRRLHARRAAEAGLQDRIDARRPLPRPEQAAEQAEVRAVLATALGELPDREREAFVLHDLEGMNAREAAETMGIGASSVRSLLTLGRRRLRMLLGPTLAAAPFDADARGGAGRA